MDPPTIKKAIAKEKFSQKQLVALRAKSEAPKSASESARSSKTARQQGLVPATMADMVGSVGIRNLLSDPSVVMEKLRSHNPQLYNHVFHQLGKPSAFRLPLPTANAVIGNYRYIAGRYKTVPQRIEIPAGETRVVVTRIGSDYDGGVILPDATSTAAVLFNQYASSLDAASLGAGTVAMGWRNHTPFRQFAPTSYYKSASTTNLPAAVLGGVPFQYGGGTLDIEVTCQWDASAYVAAVSEGTCPNNLGRSRDAWIKQWGREALFTSSTHSPFFGDASISLHDAGFAYGKSLHVPGNSTKNLSIALPPNQGWQNHGILDGTDAVAGAQTSSNVGVTPRDNLVEMASRGFFVIKNPSLTPISVIVKSEQILYMILLPDHTQTDIHESVNIIRKEAAGLSPNPADKSSTAQPVPGLVGKQADLAPGSTVHTHDDNGGEHQITLKDQVTTTAEQAVAAHAATVYAKSVFKNGLAEGLKDGTATLGKDALSLVGKVGRGLARGGSELWSMTKYGFTHPVQTMEDVLPLAARFA